MGFGPDSVGLNGEHITARFDEPRPKCNHKGLDISSSGIPKGFIAGIWGTVVAPIGGKWGTVTVQPFNAQTGLIQYLHCSSIDVSIGDIVAPWTQLGETGKTAPPGSGITGIHLHVQCILPGTPMHSCWDRNYVDPETFPTPNMFAGQWTAPVAAVVGTSVLLESIPSYDIGAVWPMENRWVVDSCDTAHGYFSRQITGHQRNAVLITTSPQSGVVDPNCGGFGINLPGVQTSSMFLKNANMLVETFNSPWGQMVHTRISLAPLIEYEGAKAALDLTQMVIRKPRKILKQRISGGFNAAGIL